MTINKFFRVQIEPQISSFSFGNILSSFLIRVDGFLDKVWEDVSKYLSLHNCPLSTISSLRLKWWAWERMAGWLKNACALRALCMLWSQVAHVHLMFCYRMLRGDKKGFRPFRAQVLMGGDFITSSRTLLSKTTGVWVGLVWDFLFVGWLEFWCFVCFSELQRAGFASPTLIHSELSVVLDAIRWIQM